MSWMGGVNGDGGADLAPLDGRNVILWRDADEVGGKAVARLMKRLPDAHWVDTAGLPDGYDAADLERDGCDDPEAWLLERERVPETGQEGHFLTPQPAPQPPPGGAPPPPDDAEPQREPEPEGKTELYGPPTEAEFIASLAALDIADLAAMDELAFKRIAKPKAALLGVSEKDLIKRVNQVRRETKEKMKAGANIAPPKERLTGDARQAEIERLADLKETDPIEYDEQREAAADSIGCRVTTLDEAVDKIIEDRAAVRQLNNPPPPPGPAVDTPEVTALVAEFNAKYFVLNEAGKTVIYAPKHDHQLHRDYFERITFPDFERLYLNRFVKTGVSDKTGEPIYSAAAYVWLRHRNRRQYIDGMVFDPSGRKQDDGVFNLWQGFGVKTQPGSWQKFKDHILICHLLA